MRRGVLGFWLFFSVFSVCWAEDLSRSFERSFPAADQVQVDVTRGVIEVVNTPAGGEVKFAVTLRLQSPKEEAAHPFWDRLAPDLLAPLKRDAEHAFESMQPRYKADAKSVKMTVRDARDIVLDSDITLQMTIVVRVEVPKGTRLAIRTVAAGVTTEDFIGSIEVRGEQGSCFFKSVSGDLAVRTLSGSITVAEVGGSATLGTESGNIFAGKLRGPARLTTSNGSVEVVQAFDSIAIRGKDADIALGLARPLAPGVDLSTSAGSITLNIDRDLPLTVDADTRLLGKVRARGLEPALRRGTLNDSSLLADLNGGGETVRVRTKWGKILLVGREPLEG